MKNSMEVWSFPVSPLWNDWRAERCKKMTSRRGALRIGNALNNLAEHTKKIHSLYPAHVSADDVRAAEQAVRGANEIIYQYYQIPRAIREEYFVKGIEENGLSVQDLAEE